MLKIKRCLNGFRFRPSILYSTSSSSVAKDDVIPNPFMAEFLIKSVGFSEDEAVSIVANCKVSHRFNSTAKSQLVLDFLKTSGFEDTHIKKLVASIPELLRSDVDQTLKPKIRAFQELGFSGSNLGLIISRYPFVLKRSLNDHIVPALESLKSLIGSNEQLVSILLKPRSPKLLSAGFLKYLPENVMLLQSYGLSRERVATFVLRNPQVFLQSTQSLGEIVKGVEEKLGIPRTSAMFMYGICGLGSKTGDRLESWLGVFRGFGWSEADISKLLRKFPPCLTLSEDALRAKLKYLTEDLGYGCDYLVKHPALLSYSVEKRIVPRSAVMRALREKQLLKNDVCFYNFVGMAESKFMEKHMVPARDKLPELYEYYIQTRAGSLTKP